MMALCSTCSAKEKVSSVRQGISAGKIEQAPDKMLKPNTGQGGWFREQYWHSEASQGHKVPKFR